ncbi:ABC transporter substrate-binding protein [Vibrio sp. DW001]|uniref:ABC transporter substrate-binding protein n=1 Tax=Vibrio sp. DW001 TaxID=2912315 RepID=UPI0023AF9CD4|nr:ABC transporter substrate-binding protein [Vibrio sp. DW001]WED25723.1 ABC transporter substrate-binding protein [Vibrio sp. DW001]
MKYVLLILLSSLTLFPSISYATNVIFLNPAKKGDRFWDMVTETMVAAADDFDMTLEVIYADRSRSKMMHLGKEIANRPNPPDYLILVNEEQSAETVFLETLGSDIKTLMLLNDFTPIQHERIEFAMLGNQNLVGSVIPDNYSAGQRQMQALHLCAKPLADNKLIHMLAIGGDKVTPASIERNLGALSVIRKNDDIVLDRFLYANWSQEEARRLTDSYIKWSIQTNIQATAIWAANDLIAIGAKQAIEANGLNAGTDICVVGLNWSMQGLKLVKSGHLVATDGGHFLAGAWALVALNDYHTRTDNNNKTPLGKIHFQMQSIDSTNVDQYLTKLGDENWSKINFKGFELTNEQSYSDYDFSLQNVFAQIEPNHE